MVNLAGNFFGKFYSGQILTAIPGNSRSNLTCHCSAETEASFEVFAGDYLCSQGLEFVLAGEHSYPADYPELGTEITVVGTFQTYEENGYVDYHLVDAEMTE